MKSNTKSKKKAKSSARAARETTAPPSDLTNDERAFREVEDELAEVWCSTPGRVRSQPQPATGSNE